MADNRLFDPNQVQYPSSGDSIVSGFTPLAISEVLRMPRDYLFSAIPDVPEAVKSFVDFGTQYSIPGLLSQYAATTPTGQEFFQKAQEFSQTPTGQTIGNLFAASELAFPATNVLTNFRTGAQRLSQNLVNNLQRSPDAQFYLSKPKAKELALAKNPELKGQDLESEMESIQRLSRIKATTGGLAEGINNFIKQSFSPQGMAEFNQRGVSQTALNLARNPNAKPEELAGQFMYEALVGRGYQNLKPILKKLDDEYFTHTGLATVDDFKKFAKGVDDVDAEAFYRTIVGSQGIKDPSNTILVARQPTQTARTGQLRKIVASASAKVPTRLSTIFPLEKGFTRTTFLNAHKKSGKELSGEQQDAIRKAFDINPELKNITDPEQFITTLEQSLPKGAKFPVRRIVKDAVFNTKQRGFQSNAELRQALEPRLEGSDIRIISNKTQTDLPENQRDIFLTTSTVTDAFELGGVGIVYRIKPDGTLTGVLHDTNDLFGIDAPGSMKTVVATPPITQNMLDIKGAGKVVNMPEEPSGAIETIRQELQTPVDVRASDIADVGANIATVGLPTIGALTDEEDPLAPTIE